MLYIVWYDIIHDIQYNHIFYGVHDTVYTVYMHSGRIVFPAGAVGSQRPSGVDLQPYRTTTDGAPHYRLQPINDHDEDLFHFDDENYHFFSQDGGGGLFSILKSMNVLLEQILCLPSYFGQNLGGRANQSNCCQ